MSLEIRELIIKASVSAGGQQPGAQGGAAGISGSENNGVSGSDEIVNTCIERILEILREKNER